MKPRLYVVPYDSGSRAVRMGNGPLHLASLLRQFPQELIEAPDGFRAEIKTSFDLYRSLAERLLSATGEETPVVLAGNCGASIGTLAGVGADDLAVLWLDAHGDFMTPETTTTGYLDGMPLSVIAGLAWRTLARSIPRFKPVPADRLVHVGARDFSDGEQQAFRDAGVALLAPGDDVAPALDDIRTRASRIVIHVDLDVIDKRYGAANHYAVGGGLSPDDVCAVVDACVARFDVAAMVLASYDPSYDGRGAIAHAAMRIIERGLRGRRSRAQ